MNPYKFIRNYSEGKSLLSLCSGIGLEFNNLSATDVTAVDISPEYVLELNKNHPSVKAVCMDALNFVRSQPDNSYDVVTLVDGLEHMTKARGREILKGLKRIAKQDVLLFFPQGQAEDGYLKNEPHDAWGIAGADEHQTHKSGWTEKEAVDFGYTLLAKSEEISQHGEPYTALMFVYHK